MSDTNNNVTPDSAPIDSVLDGDDYNTRIDICLRCPRGCQIETILDPKGKVVKMTGNQCKLGLEYVTQEIADPRRILPTSIRVDNGQRPMVPVWTPEPIPKHLLMELAEETRTLHVEAPVSVGDVIIDDWRGMGIRLITSGEVARKA